MKNGYIALIDSGIGGISLLLELLKILPNEKYLYFGDNDNAPYGSKSISELREITLKNIDYIKRYDVKLLVVACNTLSVNLLEEIKAYSGIETFGVFPPVELAVMNGARNLLLSTERTAENFKEVKNLTAVGLKYLAKDIENYMFSLNEFSLKTSFGKENKKSILNCYYDNVILGCTHYIFIKNQIFDHFRPRKILFGEYFTAKVVKKFLISSKSLVNYKQNSVLFIGKNSKINQKFYNLSGQN